MLHGFYRSDRNGLIIFGHGGDVNQFHSNLTLIPAEELGIFVSFNTDPSSAARSNIVTAFVNHFFPVDYLRPVGEAADVALEDYAGEYLSLRRNYSTFERAAMLVNNLTIATQDNELIVGANRASRWTAVAPDRFTSKYADRTMVFERDATGEVSHMIVGSPLGSYQRVRGLDAPSNIRGLLIFSVLVALLAVLGYGYRAFRRAPAISQLPTRDVFLGWLHAVLLLGLYAQLGQTLAGNAEEFSYGVPTSALISLLLININLLIGAALIVFSIRQWLTNAGGIGARIRYSVLSLTVLVSAWIAYYFNFITYLFS